jgi:hypothetical protein
MASDEANKLKTENEEHNLNSKSGRDESENGQDSSVDEAFPDHSEFCKRMAKTLYFANKLPSTPRPSFPLTSKFYGSALVLSCTFICK